MQRKLLGWITFLSLIGLVITGCSSADESNGNNKTAASEQEAAYPNADLLVDTNWVKENLDNENVRFVDVRDEEGYDGGHIPGAVNVTWQGLNDPNNPVEGFLLPAEEFSKVMEQLGITNDTTVVAYDEGKSMGAARLFYALEYYGHNDVKIVNGGYTAWLSAGEEVSTEASKVDKGTFTAKAQEELISTQTEVEDNIDNEDVVFLDVRSAEEYNGENVRAKRGGHIPNAVNLEWSQAMTEKDGVPVFKSQEELEALLEEAGVVKEKTIVPYCQTNARGAHTYFVLRLLGYDEVKPYEGSWSEWGNLPDTPIES